MIYVSFDIGVKNLALCIIKKDDLTNKLEIIEWRIIALAESKKEIKGIEDRKSAFKSKWYYENNTTYYIWIF